MTHHMTSLGALGRGLVAGAAGTAALTASQLIASKITGEEMPTAAGVTGKRILEGVFLQKVPEEQLPALNQAVHWSYGSLWGGVYGLSQGTLRLPVPLHGPLFGTVVGSTGALALWGLRMMPPPWQAPPQALAVNTLHHVVYGIAAAATFHALSP